MRARRPSYVHAVSLSSSRPFGPRMTWSPRRVRDASVHRRLGDVVKAEMPAVEKKNVQLLLQMSADRKKVAELEADILKRLSEAQGNILDDEDLINTLAESKKVSIMIGKRMEAAVVTKQEIDEAREAYRTVATRGSIIYFVIADMALTQRPFTPSTRF